MSISHSAPSPLAYARVLGLLYVVLLVCGLFSLVLVPSMVVVPGDPRATANNLVENEWLVRVSLAGRSIIFFREVAISAVLLVLLRAVSIVASLIATLARL